MGVSSLNLSSTFLRLRADASVESLPVDDRFWTRLISGDLGSFQNEFMVSMMSFDSDWTTWEMHPRGDEIVCLLSGEARFILEESRANRTVTLTDSGSFVLVPKGVWHTAHTSGPCRMLFITAGEGTQHRNA